MKKIALSLLALSALSTAAFAAGNRNWDLRDSNYYTTSGVAADVTMSSRTDADVMQAPLAVESRVGLTPFERTTMLSIANDHGRH